MRPTLDTDLQELSDLTESGADESDGTASAGGHGGGTRLCFVHDELDLQESGSTGPDWEYYLDRMATVLQGGDPDAVRFEDHYPALEEHYRPG